MIDPVDAVVVGAGAGGAACAWRLASQGLRVLVLEAGPEFSPADYPASQPGWELIDSPVKAGSQGRYTMAPMQALPAGHDHLHSWNHLDGRLFRDGHRHGLAYQHVRGVGGSTLHFTGEAHRLHPDALRLRSRHGVGADWPLSYEELEPYYALAEAMAGVAGLPDPARPRRTPYPCPPHPPSYASELLMRRTASLGRRWQPNPLAVLSRPDGDRPPCNYCGQCNRGCPRRDKGSVDVTYIPKARASGRCAIVSGATVTQLLAGDGDRVAALLYRDRDGAEQRVDTRVVVLAAGAVETPRLLLLSAGPRAAAGLGNEQGLVGRHLLETLFWSTAAVVPEPLGSYRGLPADIICWDFNAPDAIAGLPGGFRINPLTTSVHLAAPTDYALRVVDGWGAAHKRAMRQAFGNALAIGAVGESLPDPGSFVDLDPVRQDDAGLPLARIHSHLDDLAIRRLAAMAGACREIVAAVGAARPFEELGAFDMFNATHVFGTARMGDDPATSVVDSHGRSHRWRNLFIADGSVFPSSGGGEAPSLTIQALALRTADAIRAATSRRDL